MSTYVGETDEIAQKESREGIWYFLRNCLKGPSAPGRPPAHLRAGHSLYSDQRIPRLSEELRPNLTAARRH
jgi:hypothetical protein